MKKAVRVLVVAIVLASVFGVITLVHPTFASTSMNSIMKKAMLEGIYQAYNTQHVTSEFEYKNYGTFDSTILKNSTSDGQVGFPNVYNDLNDSDVSYKQLFMGYDTYGATGKNRFEGAFKLLKNSEPASSTGGGSYEWKDQFIQGMGYKVTNEEELKEMQGEYCVSVYYSWSSFGVFESDREGEEASHYICAKVTSTEEGGVEGAVMADHPYVKSKTDGSDVIDWEIKKSQNKVYIDCATMSQYWQSGSSVFGSIFGANSLANLLANGEAQNPFRFIGSGTCDDDTPVEYILGKTKWVDFRRELIQKLMNEGSSFKISGTRVWFDFLGVSSYTVWFTIGSDNYHEDDPDPLGFLYEELDSKVLLYKYGIPDSNYTNAAGNAIKYLTGASSFSYDNTTTGAKLTDKEIFILYDKYIKDYYGIKREKSVDSTTGTSDYLHVRLINDSTGDVEEKYVQVNNKSDKVYGVKDDKHFSKKITAEDVANFLLTTTSITHIDPSELEQYKTTSSVTGDEPEGECDPDKEECEKDSGDDCYTNAGSLGWVVCPIIETGGKMVRSTYEGVVVPFLRVDPKLFKQSFEDSEGDEVANGTYLAWEKFRDIANIAFVIVFLIVIFSQLTGYGIDNYGIKKILPKLIVCAILINMSYIICQLAIDIANIVGGSIGAMFSGFGNDILSNAPASCEGCSAASSGGVGFFALILVVAAITTVAVLAIGPQILIPVLLAIISFVVAVFFLFVILGIRQALTVLLVAASPLAFICYMLPNTKSIFDKWFNTLKGLLIAYPVCSALVYGGDMVAKIILAAYGTSAHDFATLTPILSAGIVSVAPIFLIPGVIKKSMGAIGNLSARLQGGATHRLRGRADRRLQNSALTHRQRYNDKARMDRANARMGEYSRKRAQRTINKMTDADGKVDYSKMNAAQRRAFNVANSTIAAHDQEMMSGYRNQASSIDAGQSEAMLMNSISKDGSVDMNMAEAAIDRMGQLDQGQMLEALQKFTNTDAFKKMNATQRSRMVQTLQKQDGNTVAKAYAKVLSAPGGSTKSLDEAIGDGSIAGKIAGMDKNTVANTDKDVLRYMSGENADGSTNATSSALSNSFTNEQMATAMSSGAISGKSETEFNKVISKRSSDNVKGDLDKLTTEQFATTMDSSLSAAAGVVGAQGVYNVANGHMRNLMKPGNEQLLQKVSREKYKYKTPPATSSSA